MGSRDLCELGLGISSVEERKSFEPDDTVKMPEFPSRTLTLFGETFFETSQPVTAVIGVNDHRPVEVYGQETERVSSRVSDEDDEGSNGRKKLRLTRNQSAHLEESFKRHSTLNPKQKQDLARELNLRPRQIEVWFQNRRARTKLKQTEINCEFLKKCFATLTEENRWLQKELQELKAVKFSQPLYMQIPVATLRVCPACEKII